MTVSKKRFEVSFAIKLFIIAVLAVAVIVPLFFIFTSLGSVNIGNIITSTMFLSATLNSFLVTVTASVFSVVFAFSLAFVLSRSNIRFKGIITVVLTVPMLIPSISHGMGILVLFGNNGIITSLFGSSVGVDGFWAVVLGSILYSFPVAFLMFNDIFKYEDRSVYEAADILGIPKYRQFLNITLPYLKKPLISIFFAVFTLIFTDYGVVMMVGGRFSTLPLYMYNEVIGQLNFGAGGVVAVVLMIPAVAAFILDIFNKDSGNSGYINRAVAIKPNKRRDVLSYVFCAVSIALILLPIVIFSVIGFVTKYPLDFSFSFGNVLKAFDMNAGEYLLNSLVITIFVCVVGTITAYLTAYMTARVPSKANGLLHLISILSLSIPGLVLGISYSLMYKGSFLIGTIAILVLVNTVHFFSSPYLMCYNALNKVNKNYELVAKTLHINKFRFFKDILLPETWDTVLEMFSYFFVNSMVTISAVSFLSTSANMPLSLLINSFETQRLIECAAVVSLMILVVNGLMKTAVYFIKRQRGISRAK